MSDKVLKTKCEIKIDRFVTTDFDKNSPKQWIHVLLLYVQLCVHIFFFKCSLYIYKCAMVCKISESIVKLKKKNWKN